MSDDPTTKSQKILCRRISQMRREIDRLKLDLRMERAVNDRLRGVLIEIKDLAKHAYCLKPPEWVTIKAKREKKS